MSTSTPTGLERMLGMFAAGPELLRDLVAAVPEEKLKIRRKPGKWSIHEHAVHLTQVDDLMRERVERFRSESTPEFIPYLPGQDEEPESLLALDLAERLTAFPESRARLVEAFRALEPQDWSKQARHPEYELYTPEILLRHLLMHDHLHMFRIEELWLTREEFLQK